MASPSSISNITSRSAAVKHRKLRKGTFSCWECKRRKIRCSFKPASSGVCVSCQLKDLSCVRQEFADPADNSYSDVEDRLGYVESLVTEVVQQRKAGQEQLQKGECLRRPRNEVSADEQLALPLLMPPSNPLSPMNTLSSQLSSMLPGPSTVYLILRHCGPVRLPLHVLQLFEAPGSTSDSVQIKSFPSASESPLRFAFKLIELALCLQQSGLDYISQSSVLQLGKPVRDAMREYVSVVSYCLTSQSHLVNSVEGLRILLLEAIFQLNEGNNRASWLLFRRCISVAQLIGLANNPGLHEQRMWFCFIYGDRTLSLELGLPFTVADEDFTHQHLVDTGSLSQKLDHMHIPLMRRIIARNLRFQHQRRPSSCMTQLHGELDDIEVTQNIDSEFKKAARLLPLNWWYCPKLDDRASEGELHGKTADILSQIRHYYLLVTLHQPYLVEDAAASKYSYSRSIIPPSSREMLSRFLMFRKFNDGPVYRGMDDKAFTVSIALLLAHLQGHRLGTANMLEHQRPQDLGMIDQVISSITRTSEKYDDNLSRSYVATLKKLKKVEERVFAGAPYDLSIKDHDYEVEEEGEVKVMFPMMYYGTICVTCHELESPRLPGLGPGLTRHEVSRDDRSNPTSVSAVHPQIPGKSTVNDFAPFEAQYNTQFLSLDYYDNADIDSLLDLESL